MGKADELRAEIEWIEAESAEDHGKAPSMRTGARRLLFFLEVLMDKGNGLRWITGQGMITSL